MVRLLVENEILNRCDKKEDLNFIHFDFFQSHYIDEVVDNQMEELEEQCQRE